MRLLDLNDLGLRLFEDQRLLFSSPGIAALEGRNLLTGENALARARLDPRRTHDRFWYQLDADLAAPLGGARTAADLAYAQLLSLRADLVATPLVIAAPGSFTAAQLGVLLGLLEAIGAQPVGLVDSAIAAASSVATNTPAVHVEVQRHRVLCTWLEGAHELQRVRVEELKPGFAALEDRSAAVIAQAFVRHARFDPLHNALTEQALYDRLPGWMARLAREPNVVLEMPAGSRVHRVGFARETLAEALAERIEELSEALLPQIRANGATLLLGDRAALIPGLADRLSPAILLEAAATAKGAFEHLDAVRSPTSELARVTRLPRHLPETAGSGDDTIATRITHALLGHHALRLPGEGQTRTLAEWLSGAPGILRMAPEGLCLEHAAGDVRVNGQAPGATRLLRAGDRITSGSQEVRLIVAE